MNISKDYRLFSRRNGWGDGPPARVFSSSKIFASDEMIDLTGKEIINKYKDIIDKETLKNCVTYYNWYIYNTNTIITSSQSL
jgi:hypothetical protein